MSNKPLMSEAVIGDSATDGDETFNETDNEKDQKDKKEECKGSGKGAEDRKGSQEPKGSKTTGKDVRKGSKDWKGSKEPKKDSIGGGNKKNSRDATTGIIKKTPDGKKESMKTTNTSADKAPHESFLNIKGDVANEQLIQEQLKNIFNKATKRPTSEALKPIRHPKLIYGNTYQLNAYKEFSVDPVAYILEAALEEHLRRNVYNSSKVVGWAKETAMRVLRKVTSLKFDRYKIIVMVTITSRQRQGVFSGFRALWDSIRDRHVTKTMSNETMHVVATVYGIYMN